MRFVLITMLMGCQDTSCSFQEYYSQKIAAHAMMDLQCDYDVAFAHIYDVLTENRTCTKDSISPRTDLVMCMLVPMIEEKLEPNYLDRWHCKIKSENFLKNTLKCK
jgi:hypothetical protein